MSETLDSPEFPTAEGMRRYPPAGFKDGEPCTCEDCPNPCNGAFCGCSACYDGHEVLDHPTHHRPFMFACGTAVAVTLVLLLPLGALLGSMAIPAGVFFAMIVAILMWAFRYSRHCNCARCGAQLARDPRSPRGSYFYFCQKCKVVWESLLRST